MSSLSKSEEILRALSHRRAPMSARQVATSTSHPLDRTRALIQFMVSSGKLEARGKDDAGAQTYGMTALGRQLAKDIEGHGDYIDEPIQKVLQQFSASPESETSPSPEAPSPQPADHSETDNPLPSIHALPAPELRARFGVLNSGELIVISPRGRTIIVPPGQLAELRATLGDRP